MIPLFLLLLAGRISGELQLKLHPDVDSALKAGRAVVALESTIISHGMPYPQNVQTAREVEAIVSRAGAVPATVAILDGVCCIGLSDDELDRFGKLGNEGEVSKVSRRDLAAVVARGYGPAPGSTRSRHNRHRSVAGQNPRAFKLCKRSRDSAGAEKQRCNERLSVSEGSP